MEGAPMAPDSATADIPVRRLLSVAQVAEILGVSDRTVRTRIMSGELPTIRLNARGFALRIDPSDLEDYIDRCRSHRPPPAVPQATPEQIEARRKKRAARGKAKTAEKPARKPKRPR